MPLTDEQIQIAAGIDRRMMPLLKAATDEITIFMKMEDLMPVFKRILDTASPGDMDQLCQRYEGFYRYSKILEVIAQGLSSGDIQLPNP